MTELPQQSPYSPQQAGVVIDDKNKVAIWRGYLFETTPLKHGALPFH